MYVVAEDEDWVERIFVAKSPVDILDGENYIVLSEDNEYVTAYKYAKPLSIKTKPVVDDEIFTWEE